jgi:hypothetical protein
MLRLILFSCFFSLLLSQCSKPEDPGAPPPDDPIDTTTTTPVDPNPPIIALGKGFFKKNGKNWPGKFEAWLVDSSRSLIVRTNFTWSNYIKETLLFFDCPAKPGKYEFESAPFFNDYNGIPQAEWLMSEIDLGLGDFKLDPDRWSKHYIEILRYDTAQQIVEGRFELFFRNYSQGPVYGGEPDSVVITEGKFHLKAEKL